MTMGSARQWKVAAIGLRKVEQVERRQGLIETADRLRQEGLTYRVIGSILGLSAGYARHLAVRGRYRRERKEASEQS